MDNYHAMVGYDTSHIKKAEEVYRAQKKKVETEKYVEQVLFRNFVDTVKSNISHYDFMYEMISKAGSEISIQKKLKKDRENINTLTSIIIDDFLNKDKSFEITKIVGCGYETYAWSIHMNGYDTNFRIGIPVMKNITFKNIEYAYNGQFAFAVEEKDGLWTLKNKSYTIKEMSDYLKDYFGSKQREKKTSKAK